MKTFKSFLRAVFLFPFNILMGMSTAAQLAQGTKLYKAGAAGGAKTISGAAPGFPTIVTATAHGLANGDVITVAAIVGTLGTDATNGLNGKTLVINSVTANTFCVEVNTTGLVYTSGGTATPPTWVQIKENKGIKPSGSSASKIDVTDLDSVAMESRTGLVDNGTFSIDIHILESDPGQAACLAAFNASTVDTYKIVSPLKTRTFSASCTKWPTIPDSSVNGVQTGSAEFVISGEVTVS